MEHTKNGMKKKSDMQTTQENGFHGNQYVDSQGQPKSGTKNSGGNQKSGGRKSGTSQSGRKSEK